MTYLHRPPAYYARLVDAAWGLNAIAERRRQTAGTLSGGEQQMLAALDMCDRAYLLESGTLTLEGTGRELIDNPHIRKAYLGG